MLSTGCYITAAAAGQMPPFPACVVCAAVLIMTQGPLGVRAGCSAAGGRCVCTDSDGDEWDVEDIS